MNDQILTYWEQFRNWLSGDEAQKIIKNEADDLIDSFCMGVIAREWFYLNVLDIDSYDLCLDEYNFIPSFIINSSENGSILTIMAKLDEFEKIRDSIFTNKQSLNHDYVIIVLYYSKLNELGSLFPNMINERLINFEKNIYFLPLCIPIMKYQKKDNAISINQFIKKELTYLPKWIQEDYLINLSESLRRLDPILQRQKRIYNISLDHAIDLTLAFQESSEVFKIDDLMYNAMLKCKNIILLGIGGSGKTTLVRQLTRRYALEKIDYIPIYIQLNHYRELDLVDLIIDTGIIRFYGINKPTLIQLAELFQTIPIVFIFDGYDELDLSYRDKFWIELNMLKNSDIRIIITGRFLEDLKYHMNNPVILSIRTMIPSQIEEMVMRYEGINSIKVLDFIEKRRLEKEAKIPLWLFFIMLVVRIPMEKRKNSNVEHLTRGQIYQCLIEYYFLEQWESKQPSNIPLDVKRDFLSELSFNMHCNHMVSLRRKDIFDIYLKNKDYFGKYDFEDYLSELQRHQLLIYEAGCYQFPHKTFLEYFAALKLSQIINSSDVKSYLNDHWYETFRFCIGLQPTQNSSFILNTIMNEHPDWYLKSNIGGIGIHKFLDILFEIRNFIEIQSEGLNYDTLDLLNKIKIHIELFSQSDDDSIAEYGIKLCQLLHPVDSLHYLQSFLLRSQNIRIEVVDSLGKVFTEDTIKVIVDQIMLSDDERVLRRAVDHPLKKFLSSRSPIFEQTMAIILERIGKFIPSTISNKQLLKRRWHLFHLLAQIDNTLIPSEKIEIEYKDEYYASMAYLYSFSDPEKSKKIICDGFSQCSEISEENLRKAINNLLNYENFYLRRTASHFIRTLSCDLYEESKRAISDDSIEVRFSALTSLINLYKHFPQYKYDIIKWIIDAIINHPEDEEEHFRQVALGVIQEIDYQAFLPLAFAYLHRSPPVFRIDLIHNLKKVKEGFWYKVALLNLRKISQSNEEPQNVVDEAESILSLLDFVAEKSNICLNDSFMKKSTPENPKNNSQSSKTNDGNMKIILILAANPNDTSPIRLDEEVREIANGLQRSKRRDVFILKQQWASRPIDVRRAMLDYMPNVVHYCGHGEGEEGIVFEDEKGFKKIISAEILSDFFQLFSDKVECVFLNACYSEIQAKAIGKHIKYVVGMRKAIGDKAAIEFSTAFYDSIGVEESIEFAYKIACNAIRWAGIPEHLTPVLIKDGKLTKQHEIRCFPPE